MYKVINTKNIKFNHFNTKLFIFLFCKFELIKNLAELEEFCLFSPTFSWAQFQIQSTIVYPIGFKSKLYSNIHFIF